MKAIDALNKIKQLGQPVLHTKEVAMILKIPVSHASQLLRRLSQACAVVSLKKGLWLIDKSMDPYQLIPYLTAPFPSYLSLQSALYFHGMISQIPEIIYVISVARTHRLHTVVGDYSIHHVNPDFFSGFTISDKNQVPIATPEKALIDFLYLSPAKSKYFHSLPELSFPKNFSQKRVREYINLISSKRTQSLVNAKFKDVFSNANRFF